MIKVLSRSRWNTRPILRLELTATLIPLVTSMRGPLGKITLIFSTCHMIQIFQDFDSTMILFYFLGKPNFYNFQLNLYPRVWNLKFVGAIFSRRIFCPTIVVCVLAELHQEERWEEPFSSQASFNSWEDTLYSLYWKTIKSHFQWIKLSCLWILRPNDKIYCLDPSKKPRALANLWTLALQIPNAKLRGFFNLTLLGEKPNQMA